MKTKRKAKAGPSVKAWCVKFTSTDERRSDHDFRAPFTRWKEKDCWEAAAEAIGKSKAELMAWGFSVVRVEIKEIKRCVVAKRKGRKG